MKISLVMAICLFACLITACGDKVVTTTYEITNEFENIKVDVDTVDVEFLPTEGKCKVECTESKEGKYVAEVIGTELRVRSASSGGFVVDLGIGKEKIIPFVNLSHIADFINSQTISTHMPLFMRKNMHMVFNSGYLQRMIS